MLPLLLLVPLMYFVMIRPQQKRQKQWQEMLGGIKSGDRVTTAGGIRGVILSIKDYAIIISVAGSVAAQMESRDRVTNLRIRELDQCRRISS
jgi:preprotein translocase YajC subunit